MDGGVLAAIRRFPERRQAIETLAGNDESFRMLCGDLAEAEAALTGWQASTAAVRDARCAEYEGIVQDLAREIEEALGAKGHDGR